MNRQQRLLLILLIVVTLAVIKFTFFGNIVSAPQIPDTSQEQATEQAQEQTDQDIPKSYVNIYFIGQNANKEEVYKIVKREYNQAEGTKLKYSINSLLEGPNEIERAKGIYSEIPKGTKLISLEETPEKIVINLSGDFEQGGGTDSLYKRLYQLIKTSNKNTALDVYLNINGKQADVVGGEGIMINQPLNSKSLDE